MKTGKWIIAFLVLLVLILAYGVFHFRFEQYRTGVLARLDPLEVQKAKEPVPDQNGGCWIIGDSRAWHWDKTLLMEKGSGISNLGARGQSSRQVLERFRNDLEISKPDLVIIQVGINDLKCIGLSPDRNIAKNCSRNIIEILSTCEEHGIEAVYTTIFPVGRPGLARKLVWEKSTEGSIVTVNREIEEFCRQRGFGFFDAHHLLLNEEGTGIDPAWERDFLHLNEAAYVFLSEELRNTGWLPSIPDPLREEIPLQN